MRGSFSRRGDSWTAIVDLPPNPSTGKRTQKRVTARTKKEVELKIAELIGKGQAGYIDAGKVTVSEFLARWIEATEPSLAPSTARRYRDVVRLHINSQIGNTKLGKLTPLDVQALYANRRKAGLSETSVRHVHAILHTALETGVKWGLLLRNVADSVEAPRPKNPEMKVWSPDETKRFLTATKDDPLEALWHLALTTGMRRGELLGLRWSDIDFDNKSLYVRRSLSRGSSSRLEAKEPKTTADKRRITLPVSVLAHLQKHQRAQKARWLQLGEAYGDREWVFASIDGRPIHPNSLSRAYTKLIATAKVPTIRFHDIRHTSATLLLAGGEHPKVVQERLGHASISETLDRYSHVTSDMQQRAADHFDALLCQDPASEQSA